MKTPLSQVPQRENAIFYIIIVIIMPVVWEDFFKNILVGEIVVGEQEFISIVVWSSKTATRHLNN